MTKPTEIDADPNAIEEQLDWPQFPCEACHETKPIMMMLVWNEKSNPHTQTLCVQCAIETPTIFNTILDAILKMKNLKDPTQ
jgi:hypothetical protein